MRHFLDAYEAVREWVLRCEHPGLAVAAIGPDGIQATAYLKAKPSGINTAIIGRHSRAEIFLDRDPSISLRHLGVIVHPTSSPDEVRFRLLDLRTPSGFRDSRGVDRRAIESNTPYAAACGEYALVFVPVTEPAVVWPEDPERFSEAFGGDVLTNPEMLEGLRLGSREEPLGELVVTSSDGAGAVAVSRRAVGSGILLGRSERCDGDSLLTDPHISRVHLLIVEIGGRLYAVDTASKNGVYGKVAPERATVLETGTTLSLAGRATVEWRFFH
jgi:pSer/pThr/pTyr-binding forkhead associated (FHA) protein